MKVPTVLAGILIASLSFAAVQGADRGDDRMRAFRASIKEETAGNYPRAIQHLTAFKGNDASDYLVHLRLGWLYYLAQEYQHAATAYEEAMRLGNRSIESLLGSTLPNAALGRWDRVQDAYEEIIGKDEMHYTANPRLGQIYFNKANYLMARKYFEKIGAQYPSEYEVSLYLGWTYHHLGSKSKARQASLQAMAVNPADTSASKGYDLCK